MKVLNFSWSICAMLLTMFYESNLRAYLMKADSEDPIDTPRQLMVSYGALFFATLLWPNNIQDSGLDLLGPAGGLIDVMLMKSLDESTKEFGKRISKDTERLTYFMEKGLPPVYVQKAVLDRGMG